MTNEKDTAQPIASDEPTLTQKQTVELFFTTVLGNVMAEAEHYAAQGIPKEMFLSALLVGVAHLSIECNIPTAKIGMGLATARQGVEDQMAEIRRKGANQPKAN